MFNVFSSLQEPPSLCTGTESTPGLWLPQSYEELRALVPQNLIYRAQSGASSVVRTAPGVVVKYGGTGFSGEVHAMEFIRHKTSIPIPRVLHAPDWYICMEEARGTSLDKTIEFMTTFELDHIALQLKEFLKQLRSVTPKARTLGSVTGGSYPHRNQYFPKQVAPDRPLDSTSQFIDEYRRILMLFCTQNFTDELLTPFPRDVDVVLSHGDLLPQNIMVDGSTITAIIDWELAGYYPEYLEYCRMNSDIFMTPKWHYVIQSVLPGDPHQPLVDSFNRLTLVVWTTLL